MFFVFCFKKAHVSQTNKANMLDIFFTVLHVSCFFHFGSFNWFIVCVIKFCICRKYKKKRKEKKKKKEKKERKKEKEKKRNLENQIQSTRLSGQKHRFHHQDGFVSKCWERFFSLSPLVSEWQWTAVWRRCAPKLSDSAPEPAEASLSAEIRLLNSTCTLAANQQAAFLADTCGRCVSPALLYFTVISPRVRAPPANSFIGLISLNDWCGKYANMHTADSVLYT